MEERLVTIATDHYTAAEVLRARFENAGIKVFLKHVNLLQGAVSEGVQVQIRESDVEHALRLMAEWKSEQEEADKRNLSAVRRILVPVDFSGYSKNACLFALDLARKLRADLKILHVYYAPIVDLVPITDAYSIQIDMDINLREMESRARKGLAEFVEDIRKESRKRGVEGVRIGYALREGIVEDEIARVARDYKPGLVVLGARGKGDKQGDIVGSVVYRVLDRIRVPVLVIPANTSYEEGKEVNNIVYATDFDDSDYLAIRRLIGIVSAFPVRIHCIHVSRDPGKKWDDVKMQAVRDYFGRVHKGLQVECHLLRGEDILKEVEEFTNARDIDLFALTNRKRNLIARLFNPGLTRKLINQGNVPLLVFRA
jgi:nucleotide-binding universal stress UspA family protein